MTLKDDQLVRYGRHLSLPGIDASKQCALLAAKVLVIGAGGLGSPILTYLAAAGVGTICVADPDVVELSNLQRQVIHRESRLGTPKTASAVDYLTDLNSSITVESRSIRVTAENALSLVRGFDVVVDGSDNFATRYVVSDACALAGVPCVWGSVLQYQGQVSVFDPPNGPCYRCLYPEAPPEDLAPSCATGGVFGALCGIVGSMQAAEVIKLITGVGDVLRGRLWTVDISTGEADMLRFGADPRCELCGNRPSITEVRTYVQACGVEPVHEISPAELADLLGSDAMTSRRINLVDVREPHEWEIARIGGASLVPMSQVEEYLSSTSAAETIFYCKSGARSMRAATLAADKGHKATSLTGGVIAWSKEVLGQDLVY